MPHVTAADGTRLYYEEVGEGTPIVFVHEFGGDYRTWENQLRAFSRRYRCVTYSARGFPPSDIPADGARYSQDIAREDVIAVMDQLKIARAHLVGHSMGAYASLHVGIHHPERCFSLVATGCGFASPPERRAASLEFIEQTARRFVSGDMASAAREYAASANRQPHKRKDPRGFAEFVAHLAEHSPVGASLTFLNLQLKRPTLWELKPELEKMRLPLLVIAGDEDDDCLDAGVFLKRTVPRAALYVMPHSGHSNPIEEPAAFNAALAEFFVTVEAGRWMTHRA